MYPSYASAPPGVASNRLHYFDRFCDMIAFHTHAMHKRMPSPPPEAMSTRSRVYSAYNELRDQKHGHRTLKIGHTSLGGVRTAHRRAAIDYNAIFSQCVLGQQGRLTHAPRCPLSAHWASSAVVVRSDPPGVGRENIENS